MQLKANTDSTVVQSIQNELVLVNLESGIYYFLAGSGAVIFSVLDSGCPLDKLVGQLGDRYGSDVSGFKAHIDSFIDQLLAESLLIEGIGSAGLVADDYLSKPFECPVLNKCEDLQDLLLLDPVVARAAFDGQTESN